MPDTYVIRTAPTLPQPVVAVVKLNEDGTGEDAAWCFDEETARLVCDLLNALGWERKKRIKLG